MNLNRRFGGPPGPGLPGFRLNEHEFLDSGRHVMIPRPRRPLAKKCRLDKLNIQFGIAPIGRGLGFRFI